MATSLKELLHLAKTKGWTVNGCTTSLNDQQGVLTACQVNFWPQDGHYSWDTNFCESMLRVHKMFPDSDSEFRCWHTKFCHMKADIFRKIAVKTDIDIDTLKKLFLGRFIWCFFWVEPTINEVLGRYNIERMIFHKTHAGSTSISTVNIVYMGWLGQQKNERMFHDFPINSPSQHPCHSTSLPEKRRSFTKPRRNLCFYLAVLLR